MTAALPKTIRLRTLNALLASMVGTAPQLRSDVDAVLRVFEADDETDPRLNAADLAAAAAQIFRLLSPDRAVPTIEASNALSVRRRIDFGSAAVTWSFLPCGADRWPWRAHRYRGTRDRR